MNIQLPKSLISYVSNLFLPLFKNKVNGELLHSKLLSNFLLCGEALQLSEKDYRSWISTNALHITSALQANPNESDFDVLRLLEIYKANKNKNEEIFKSIQTHHLNLAHKDWESLDSSDLIMYGVAAQNMGDKQWVQNGNKWVEQFSLEYFKCNGASKAFIKEIKNFGHQNQISGTDCNTIASCINSKLASVDYITNNSKTIPTSPYSNPIRLLDVGSCYNPFLHSTNAHLYNITAIDLYPKHESVLECDFLALDITLPDTVPVYEDLPISDTTVYNSSQIETTSSSSFEPSLRKTRRKLISLPAQSFDVITMCLVLNYIPDHIKREVMISKARMLLRHTSVGPEDLMFSIISRYKQISYNPMDSNHSFDKDKNIEGNVIEDIINDVWMKENDKYVQSNHTRSLSTSFATTNACDNTSQRFAPHLSGLLLIFEKGSIFNKSHLPLAHDNLSKRKSSNKTISKKRIGLVEEKEAVLKQYNIHIPKYDLRSCWINSISNAGFKLIKYEKKDRNNINNFKSNKKKDHNDSSNDISIESSSGSNASSPPLTSRSSNCRIGSSHFFAFQTLPPTTNKGMFNMRCDENVVTRNSDDMMVITEDAIGRKRSLELATIETKEVLDGDTRSQKELKVMDECYEEQYKQKTLTNTEEVNFTYLDDKKDVGHDRGELKTKANVEENLQSTLMIQNSLIESSIAELKPLISELSRDRMIIQQDINRLLHKL